MPGFLRKKTGSVAKSRTHSEEPQVVISKPQNTTRSQSSNGPTTPLYERFAAGGPVAVSGPMTLGSQKTGAVSRPSVQQQRPGPRLVSAPSIKQRSAPSQNQPESRGNDDKPLPQAREIKPLQRGASLAHPTRNASLHQPQKQRLGDAIAPRRVDYSEPEPLHRPSKPDAPPAKTSIYHAPPSRRLSTAEKSYEAKPISLTSERYSLDTTRPPPEIHHHHLSQKRDFSRISHVEPPRPPSSQVDFRSSGYQSEAYNSPIPNAHIPLGHNGYNPTPHIPTPHNQPMHPQQSQQHQHQHQQHQRHPSLSNPPQAPTHNGTSSMSGKPLIFAAMEATEPEAMTTPRPQPPATNYWENGKVPYPSPPQEFAPARSNTVRRELPRPPVQPTPRNFTSPPAPAHSPFPQGYASTSPPQRTITPDFTPVPRQAATPDNSPPRNSRNISPRESETSLRVGTPPNQRDSFVSANSHLDPESRASTPSKHKLLTKNRPTTPVPRGKERPLTPNSSNRRDLPGTPVSAKRDRIATPPPRTALLPTQPVVVNGITIEGADSAELLDSDPFAKAEGVLVYNANGTATHSTNNLTILVEPDVREKAATPSPSIKDEHAPSTPNKLSVPEPAPAHSSPKHHKHRDEKRDSHGHRSHKSHNSVSTISSTKSKEEKPPVFFPLARFISSATLLGSLLRYLSYSEWCNLSAVSKKLRYMLHHTPQLREEVLERYLWTIGYTRWDWGGRESLPISIKQLHEYMHGVSIPTFQYAQVSQSYLNAVNAGSLESEVGLRELAGALAAGTRAYTRLVCRIRAQIEAEQAMESQRLARARSGNFPSARAPSPSRSIFSTHQSIQGQTTGNVPPRPMSPAFRSPLYKPRRAPLLRLFVPNPEGDWLSDASVLQCEGELKTAVDNSLSMLRVGDVVWDLALGDEGNVGRMIWDGCYLIDLDYTFSPIGDLPKYIHSLAFPPSYFHRVIRPGPGSGNPIAHIDISPWGEEIASNLQLLQDRIRTETPQGNYHNVVRWVHRSSFQIRPSSHIMTRSNSSAYRNSQAPPRIPIPGVPGAFVDSGWFGTIVVETEGTNEHLADLQDRCGPRAFPQRKWSSDPRSEARRKELKNKFRILREKSRPGEIWIRTVSEKEMKM